MTDEFAQRLIKVVAVTQRLSPEQVSIDNTFEELGIDSLDAINLLFAIETEFDLTVPDEARSISTMRELAEGIRMLLRDKAGELAAKA